MITKFEQDAQAPAGQGYFFDEKGRVSYTYDPETAVKFEPQLVGKISEESSALSPMADPRGNSPDERLADNTDPGSFNNPYVQSLSRNVEEHDAGTQLSPKVQAAVQSVNKLKPPPSMAPAGQSSGVQQSGYSVQSGNSYTSGRPVAAVQSQISNERPAVRSVINSNTEIGKEQDARLNSGYDTQLTGLDTTMRQKSSESMDIKNDLKANADKIWELSNETDPPVDPNRYVSRMPTGSKILAILGSGFFGAVGNIKGQGLDRNGFLKAFQDAVDMDTKIQEDEIRRGVAKRSNRISHYQALGADLRTSKALAERDAYEAGRRYIEIQAQKNSDNGKYQTAAQQLNNALTLQQTQREGDLWASTEPKMTSQGGNTVTFLDPAVKAATQKPPRPPTELQNIQTENARTEQDDAKEVSNAIGRNVSPSQVREIRNDAERIGKEEKDVAGAKAAYTTFITSMGGTVDQNTGQVHWTGEVPGNSGHPDNIGVGARLKANIPWNADAVGDSRDALVQYITQDLTGASASRLQDKTFKAMAGGALTNPDKVKANTEAYARTLWGQSEAIRRGNRDAARYYDYRNSQSATPPPNAAPAGGMKAE